LPDKGALFGERGPRFDGSGYPAMATESTANEQSIYFNLLAEIGHTKHIGGVNATARLVELINPRQDDAVLDIGCGVGIAPVFLAREFGCRVTGIDITPLMVQRAEERALREGVSELIDFRVADMHALPFEENVFDSAIAESVITFSNDKVGVVNELARVVGPGGVVAFTEAIFVQPPPPGKGAFMARAAGMPDGILDNEAWRKVLQASDLDDIVVEAYPITAREESKSQAGRIPFSDYLRAVPRSLKVLGKRQYRQVFRTAFSSMPKDLYHYIGYGVYGGSVV
jgi:arsenite methyltransferase